MMFLVYVSYISRTDLLTAEYTGYAFQCLVILREAMGLIYFSAERYYIGNLGEDRS